MQTTRLRRVFLALALAAIAGPLDALAFNLTDTQGKRQRLADFKGRWVVLNFWATWCVPCIQEIPEIAAFRRAHETIVVIGVALDAEDAARTMQFAAKVGHDYPLVLSTDAVEKQLGSPKALPTTRVYDPTGKLVHDRTGRVDRKLLENMVGPDYFLGPADSSRPKK